MKHDNSINGFHITCFFSPFFIFAWWQKGQHGVFCLSHFGPFLPGGYFLFSRATSTTTTTFAWVTSGDRRTGGLSFVDSVEGWGLDGIAGFFSSDFLLDWRGGGYSGSDGQGPGFPCVGRARETCQVVARTSRRRKERDTRDTRGRGMQKWGMIPMQNAGDQGPWAEEADRQTGGHLYLAQVAMVLLPKRLFK